MATAAALEPLPAMFTGIEQRAGPAVELEDTRAINPVEPTRAASPAAEEPTSPCPSVESSTAQAVEQTSTCATTLADHTARIEHALSTVEGLEQRLTAAEAAFTKTETETAAA
ncbi:hypothetical protein IWQ57_004063, partial [Coemansia nantahalensis]